MRLIFLLFVCLYSPVSATETMTFDMLLWGDKVGSLTITKTINPDGSELYVLDSKVNAKVLWINRQNTAHMETVYNKGKLISTYQKEVEDGKVKRWNRVTFDGLKYNVEGYKGKRVLKEQPTFSVALIYFNGLANVPRLFYEAEADFCKVEKVDTDTWEFKSSDGTRNVYHFKDGKLSNMEFHVSIATLKVVRVG